MANLNRLHYFLGCLGQQTRDNEFLGRKQWWLIFTAVDEKQRANTKPRKLLSLGHFTEGACGLGHFIERAWIQLQ